jgi:hypothetical protein
MGRLTGLGVALALTVGFVGVSGCDVQCTETEEALPASADGQHTGLRVHKSCGGAMGAEEDLFYVVNAAGERSLALRVHHQIGPVVFTWLDADHVEISLAATADVVDSSTPAGGVDVTMVRAAAGAVSAPAP